jgi:hypothetical protein
MKTVKDISDETGVSVQTVYRQLNKVKQNSSYVLIEKIDNIAYFTDIGETLILEKLNAGKQSVKSDKRPENNEILFLLYLVKTLNEQIERLTRMNENSQILLLNQQQTLPPPKVKLWDKLFKRKSGRNGFD